MKQNWLKRIAECIFEWSITNREPSENSVSFTRTILKSPKHLNTPKHQKLREEVKSVGELNCVGWWLMLSEVVWFSVFISASVTFTREGVTLLGVTLLGVILLDVAIVVVDIGSVTYIYIRNHKYSLNKWLINMLKAIHA